MEWADEIDPELAQLVRGAGPVIGDLTVAELPALYADRRSTVAVPIRDGVTRLDVAIESAGRRLELRIHRPDGPGSGRPGCVWMHGGGFIVGSHVMDDAVLGRWASEHGMVCVAVDYRLAPEDPYPAAIDDCDAGLEWVRAHAGDLGIDVARLGLGGSSAGGALAVALALRRRDRGEHVAFLVLDAPSLDDRQSTVSSRWDVPVAGPSTVRLGWLAYLGERVGSDDVPADAAPARAQDLHGLPPAFVAVGSVDGLHDESVEFAQRMAAHGGAVALRVYPGGIHNFARVAPRSRLAGQLRADQDAWLRARLLT